MSQIKNSLVSRHAPYLVYIRTKKEYNKTTFSMLLSIIIGISLDKTEPFTRPNSCFENLNNYSL